MADPAIFALTRSNLNAFLLAPIGEERNGMTLSVLSGLARLDLDPWAEAARLARLPAAAATEAIAQIVARLSGRWLASDSRRIAERLVVLLPGGAVARPREARPPGVAVRRRWPSGWLFWLALAALAIATIANLLA